MPSIEQTVGELTGSMGGVKTSMKDIKDDLRSLNNKIWMFVITSLFTAVSAIFALIMALMKSGANPTPGG